MQLLLVSVVNSHQSIDQSNFEEVVLSSGKVWMLEFYSSRCGSCQEFEPTFDRLAASLEDSVTIGKVGIDSKAGMDLAASLGVLDEGIPSIRLFTNSGGSTTGVPIMTGEKLLSYDELMERILKHNDGKRGEL